MNNKIEKELTWKGEKKRGRNRHLKTHLVIRYLRFSNSKYKHSCSCSETYNTALLTPSLTMRLLLFFFWLKSLWVFILFNLLLLLHKWPVSSIFKTTGITPLMFLCYTEIIFFFTLRSLHRFLPCLSFLSLSSGFIWTSTKKTLPRNQISFSSYYIIQFFLKISIHSSTSFSVFFQVFFYSFLSQHLHLQTHMNFSISML